MLLIDGVKYQEWTPTGGSAEEDLENQFMKHVEDIFGKGAVYFDLKHKLASKAGTGSIPDGYVITFGNNPQIHIVEIELSSHSLQHIKSQMIDIANGIENPVTQKKICDAIDDEINRDSDLTNKLLKAIAPRSIHRFLSDTFSNEALIKIVIDKDSSALEEAIDRINPRPKVIEFQTFIREGVGLAVHAHIFNPQFIQEPPKPPVKAEGNVDIVPLIIQALEPVSGKRTTIKDLLDANILKVNQRLYREYAGKTYEGRITVDGMILLTTSGKKFSSPSGAGSSITPNQVDGWYWWFTQDENGKEVKLADLRERYRTIQR